jgi:hypothetical protein
MRRRSCPTFGDKLVILSSLGKIRDRRFNGTCSRYWANIGILLFSVHVVIFVQNKNVQQQDC